MSKIRWTKSQQSRLSNAVRVFNTKITNYGKNPELKPYLPNKISVQDLKRRITTANDLNREIKSLQRLNKNTATPVVTGAGVKTTKYTIREAQIRINIINRRRKKLREKADVTPLKGTVGQIQDQNLQPRKLNLRRVPSKRFQQYIEDIYSQTYDSYMEKMNALYKDNYLKAFDEAFGKDYIFKKFIELIPKEVLSEMLFQDPVLTIDFVYGEEAVDMRIEQICSHMESYLSKNYKQLYEEIMEKYNNLLKDLKLE